MLHVTSEELLASGDAVLPGAMTSCREASLRAIKRRATLETITLELKLVTRTMPGTGGTEACVHALETITICPVATSRSAFRAYT